MIRIPCRACGAMLELPRELAGGEFQCPDCHRLNDIPSLHELKQINDDGTYVLDSSLQQGSPDLLAEMVYVYGKSKTDDFGNEIDLRGPRAPEEDLFRVADEPHVQPPPKYDPETGELIEPLDVKADPRRERLDPALIPMARPALGYADQSVEPVISQRSAFVNLLRPSNLVVMLLVYVLHVAAGAMLLACSYLGYFIGTCFILFLVLMLLAHWANVIDEVGREERDDLPRPFRDVQWYEDFAQPLGALVLALVLCYAPAIIVTRYTFGLKAGPAIEFPFELLATYLLPAAFLITACSGTIENLAPRRLWGTATAAGGSYAMAVLLWCVGGGLYGYCFALMVLAATPFWWVIRANPKLALYADARIGAIALVPAIFFMHYFCWQLGLIYRQHHMNFPWVFQFHRRKESEQTIGAARAETLRARQKKTGEEPAIPHAKPVILERPSAAKGHWPDRQQ